MVETDSKTPKTQHLNRPLILSFSIKLIILLISGYQLLISPLLGPRCRFYPSCSSYARSAIERHGLWSGTALALRRIAKCHPGHPGGIDEVPEPKLTVGSARKHSC